MVGVLDACSRKIVGLTTDDTMPAALVARAFKCAMTLQRPAGGFLHHSDHGRRYASDADREPLRRDGVVPSISRAGNCYGNAMVESFQATLGSERIGDHVFTPVPRPRACSSPTTISFPTGCGSTAHSAFTLPWTSSTT